MQDKRIGKIYVGAAAYLYVVPDSWDHGIGGGADLIGCTATFKEGGMVILEGFGEEYDGCWYYDSEAEDRICIKRKMGEIMVLSELKRIEV